MKEFILANILCIIYGYFINIHIIESNCDNQFLFYLVGMLLGYATINIFKIIKKGVIRYNNSLK